MVFRIEGRWRRLSGAAPGWVAAAVVALASLPASAAGPRPQRRDAPVLATSSLQTAKPATPVIKNGAVDRAYLGQLEDAFEEKPNAENRQRLARAEGEAAAFLDHQGQPELAIDEYRRGLSRVPDDEGLIVGLGQLLIRQSRPWEAIELVGPQSDQHPQVANYLLLLGSAYYAMDDLDQAMAEWKQALALQDNPQVREAIAKAQREQNVTGAYQELRSDHLVLRYDEGEAKTVADQVLDALEGDYLDLERDLDFYPQQTITVLLYPNQAFRDITRSPAWAGAVNDGKIRVPVSGLTSLTPELARVLKHELTHSFVYQIAQGHCPTWLNEGLAQLEEGAEPTKVDPGLGEALHSGRAPSLEALEKPFLDLPTNQARLAYSESLAAVEYLRDTYGMGEVRQLLKLTPAYRDFNALLEQELRLTPADLQSRVAAYLSQAQSHSGG